MSIKAVERPGRAVASYLSPARNAALAQALFQHVRDGTTDQAETPFEYDMKIYSDPDIAAAERVKIFERLPMMAMHASQVRDAHSFATIRLNRSNVLVTRGADGKVNAFLNICRHRGATVVTQASGRRSRFSCPYHGWTYDNEGELKAIAFSETTGLTPCAKRNLIRLPVEERHGFIWIVENPDGEIDVARHLGADMDAALGEYRFDQYHCYRFHEFQFPQNWKVMMDGLIDGYHVHFVHGATIRPYFYMNMMARVPLDGDHMIWGNPRRTIDKILHETPGQSSLDDYVIMGNLFMPNSVMVLHPHHIEYWTIYQNGDDPGSSRIQLRYLTRQKDHDERGVKILDKNWKIATDAVINEDVPVGNSIQSSAASNFGGTLILALNEIVNQKFHRTYQRLMLE